MSATLVEPLEPLPRLSFWPTYPSIYEINTWVWLADLTRQYSTAFDLSSVPAAEWDAIAEYGFDSVWLMGVWERSPAGMASANQNAGLRDELRRALPDFRPEDNVGSPYCIRRYVVDSRLGGQKGLATARAELSKRGINLVLDFVPNHVAPDHDWVAEHPEYFIPGTAEDLKNNPSSYLQTSRTIFACGQDPYFPAWADVLQLNAFNEGLRGAALKTMFSIAEQCDGIRCDMAMLFLNAIFARTWGTRAGSQPATEYWTDIISAVKVRHPGFLFIAEAYWDLEWQLQQKGFDFCYDKTLCDRLQHSTAENIRLHLCSDLPYQGKLLRFIENHDEPRAAATFSPEKERAAAVTMATLPGIKLFHEGQFEGRTVRPPVFLRRRPNEPSDEHLRAFYRKLLEGINSAVFREGEWKLCEKSGWPDNQSHQNLVAWTWKHNHDRCLIVVNLSDARSQGLIRPPWNDLGCRKCHLRDVISGVTYERFGGDMLSPGLYVELAPWGFHFFQFLRTSKT